MAARIAAHIMEMLFSLVRSLCGSKADLTMEVLALRQPFDSAALRSGQSTRCLQAQEPSAAHRPVRSALLVGAEGPVRRLDRRACDRQAGDRGRMAEDAVPGLLGTRVQARALLHPQPAHRVHPPHLLRPPRLRGGPHRTRAALPTVSRPIRTAPRISSPAQPNGLSGRPTDHAKAQNFPCAPAIAREAERPPERSQRPCQHSSRLTL